MFTVQVDLWQESTRITYNYFCNLCKRGADFNLYFSCYVFVILICCHTMRDKNEFS